MSETTRTLVFLCGNCNAKVEYELPAAHNADAALREAVEAGDVLAQAVHDYLWDKITGLDLANAIDDYHTALSALRSPATGDTKG